MITNTLFDGEEKLAGAGISVTTWSLCVDVGAYSTICWTKQWEYNYRNSVARRPYIRGRYLCL